MHTRSEAITAIIISLLLVIYFFFDVNSAPGGSHNPVEPQILSSSS